MLCRIFYDRQQTEICGTRTVLPVRLYRPLVAGGARPAPEPRPLVIVCRYRFLSEVATHDLARWQPAWPWGGCIARLASGQQGERGLDHHAGRRAGRMAGDSAKTALPVTALHPSVLARVPLAARK